MRRKTLTDERTGSLQRRAIARCGGTFREDGPEIRHPGLEDRTLSQPIQNTFGQEPDRNGRVRPNDVYPPVAAPEATRAQAFAAGEGEGAAGKRGREDTE